MQDRVIFTKFLTTLTIITEKLIIFTPNLQTGAASTLSSYLNISLDIRPIKLLFNQLSSTDVEKF